MNIKIESGANVQITDKPIVNVFGDVVQFKEVKVYPNESKTDAPDAVVVDETCESEADAVVAEEASVDEQALNFEAPKINLQQLLRQEWFENLRSNDKYSADWTDAFVEALMASEYSEAIARQWNNGGKLDRCTQVKGYVLGLLKDADVLKGSYDNIADRVNLMDNHRSFSRYMANGKKQPFAPWVKEYVKNHS
jgi:hypothetical protein